MNRTSHLAIFINLKTTNISFSDFSNETKFCFSILSKKLSRLVAYWHFSLRHACVKPHCVPRRQHLYWCNRLICSGWCDVATAPQETFLKGIVRHLKLSGPSPQMGRLERKYNWKTFFFKRSLCRAYLLKPDCQFSCSLAGVTTKTY